MWPLAFSPWIRHASAAVEKVIFSPAEPNKEKEDKRVSHNWATEKNNMWYKENQLPLAPFEAKQIIS